MDWQDHKSDDRLTITGADSASCYAALYLAPKVREVHIVDPKAVFAGDKLSPGRELLMIALEEVPNIKLRRETTAEEIGEGYAILQNHGELERLEGITTVIVGGRRANNQLYEQLIEENPKLEIYNIGDSVEPREVYHASAEAAIVAERIRLRALDRSFRQEPAYV
jgi:hypothetical protein